MGWVVNASGKQYFKYSIPTTTRTAVGKTSLIQHVDPEDDDHQIVIDASAPNVDKSHIYLHGKLAEDDYFIRCKHPEYVGNSFSVNFRGDVECRQITSFFWML